MHLRQLTVLLFLFGSLGVDAVLAQKKAKDEVPLKTIRVGVERGGAFDRTMDYLQKTGFFIQSVDKDSGFIQARVFVKDRRIISITKGERRTFNFVFRPDGASTKISLRIFHEDFRFSGDVGNRTYYYEEEGLLDDDDAYQEILEALRSDIER